MVSEGGAEAAKVEWVTLSPQYTEPMAFVPESPRGLRASAPSDCMHIGRASRKTPAMVERVPVRRGRSKSTCSVRTNQ